MIGDPVRFDPDTTDTRENARGKIGWYGSYPSTPCHSCGGHYFRRNGDWGMGYACIDCGTTWRETQLATPEPEPCELCQGSGRVAMGMWGSRPERRTCPLCGGTGKADTLDATPEQD